MRKSMTYGVLPSREEFDTAWEAVVDEGAARAGNQGPGMPRFYFIDDPRVGTCALTRAELWAELRRAQGEWENNGETEAECDAAGQWCSQVLGVLGFEWV